MPEMKDSGIEWIGEIPIDWKRSKIKNVCSMIGSGTTPSSNVFEYYDNGIINWIQSGDIYGKTEIRDVSTLISAKALASSSSLKIYKAPYIVIAMYGGSVGNTAISYIDACANQACCCLKTNSEVDFKFLYYWILFCREDFLVRAEGGGQPNISQDKIKNQWIYFPNKKTQEGIVSLLDVKCAEIDALVADIQSEIEILEEYKKSVITEAVTKGLNPDVKMKDSGIEWAAKVPEHWNIIKGKYIFAQRNDRGNNTNLQLLSPTQKFGVIPQELYEELTGMSAVKLKEDTNLSALKSIHKGDYCISLRSFQGGFEYSEYEGVVSPAYQVFYPVIPIADGYFKYMFKERGFIEKMNSYTLSLRDGKNIAFSDFGNSYIPVPPLEEQAAISDYLEHIKIEIDSIIDDKQKQLSTLEEYKKSVIYEYVTGKKEVSLS